MAIVRPPSFGWHLTPDNERIGHGLARGGGRGGADGRRPRRGVRGDDPAAARQVCLRGAPLLSLPLGLLAGRRPTAPARPAPSSFTQHFRPALAAWHARLVGPWVDRCL